jgi:hypothetical protein
VAWELHVEGRRNKRKFRGLGSLLRQLLVESQVALTLSCFGHSGNAAGLQKIATWAGVGKGTVLKCTRRVITAILDEKFMKANVWLPNDKEKCEAQAWVRAHSCRKWGKGYLLLNGTLVVLYDQPTGMARATTTASATTHSTCR